MMTLTPISTPIYLTFSTELINDSAETRYYVKGIVCGHLKNAIKVDFAGEILTFKKVDYSETSYKTAKESYINVSGDKVYLTCNKHVTIEAQTPELDNEYAHYFFDTDEIYPKLKAGQVVIVKGRTGKVVFTSSGNLRHVPRFLPDNHGNYYAKNLDPITTYSIPDEQDFLKSIEKNYGFGKFVAFNKVETPTLDVMIVQVSQKHSDDDGYIILTSNKGCGNWSKFDNYSHNSYSNALIHAIAEINNKSNHASSACILVGA